MKEIIQQIEQQVEANQQDLKKTLTQQSHFLEEIERSQRKLAIERERTLQNIATLRGALQAYEQSLLFLKKADAPELSEETEDAEG